MPGLAAKKKHPLWYNLSLFNLPVPGLVSIFHRISGALLFLGLIWFLYLLETSLASPAGFAQFKTYVGQTPVKLALLGFLWAYLHHFCAGIRFLFLDIDRGLALTTTRTTSYAVLAVSLLLTALLGAKLW